MNKSETNINPPADVITIRKSTLNRVLTALFSLAVGIGAAYFLNAVNVLSCAHNYYNGNGLFIAPFNTVTGDLTIITASFALILCIYGIVSSTVKKHSRLMFTVIAAAVCIMLAVFLYSKLVTIYYPERGVGTALSPAVIGIHIAYALIVFLTAEFAGFTLMKKIKYQ
ncbi:MAG: hypothetical protein NC228_02225 [[Eubacterium] siraeum]|nr:hypothetical protein [[Eubacterium] siraeum]